MSHFKATKNGKTAVDGGFTQARAYAMRQAGNNDAAAKAALQAAMSTPIVDQIRSNREYKKPRSGAERMRIAINVYIFVSAWIASGVRKGECFPGGDKDVYEWYMETNLYYSK